MKLKAFAMSPKAKKPKRMNDREYVLFVADIIEVPENDQIVILTDVRIEPPQGFRIIIEAHPHMTNYQLIQVNRAREIKPGDEGSVVLVLAKLFDIADIPARGQAVAIVRLEELSMPFELEWNGELPNKKLTKITNLN